MIQFIALGANLLLIAQWMSMTTKTLYNARTETWGVCTVDENSHNTISFKYVHVSYLKCHYDDSQ